MSYILCLNSYTHVYHMHTHAHTLYFNLEGHLYTLYFFCQRFIFSYRCLNDDTVPSSVPKRHERVQHDPSQAVYVNIEASEADDVFGTELCLHATSDTVRKDLKVCCVCALVTIMLYTVQLSIMYVVVFGVCRGYNTMYTVRYCISRVHGIVYIYIYIYIYILCYVVK